MSGTQDGATPDGKREDLESLFARWDERKGEATGVPGPPEDEPHGLRLRFDRFRLWITLTCFVTFLAGWMMWLTRHEVTYWLQRGSEPLDLGDLGERYKSGARTLDAPSNRFVKVRGLFATHESEAETDGDEVARFYLCPMFHIIVRTPRPLPDKPFHRTASLEVDSGFVPLLQERKAFPVDLVVRLEAEGRLMRATDVPKWHTAPVHHFASRTGIDRGDLWLLVEGDVPEVHGRFVMLWGLSICMALFANALLFRSWRRRRAGLV